MGSAFPPGHDIGLPVAAPVPGDPARSAPGSCCATNCRRSGRSCFLLGAVQFVNILDFMIVMPLGPDFAKDLGIPISQLGIVGGSYTAAAAVAGVLGSRFLDRFDRRNALAVSMFGLVLGTLLGRLRRDLGTLMLARVLAGAFGGPATSIALSVIADVVPPRAARHARSAS